MPKPPEYARVGGQWDKLSKRIDQLKEGLSRILALIPYDLISYDVRNRIFGSIYPFMIDFDLDLGSDYAALVGSYLHRNS